MRLRAATLAIGLCFAGSAHGATFTVTSTGDSGTGSLRTAVTAANDSEDPSDEIDLSLPADQTTIELLSPLDEITNQTLILDGSARSGLTIDGGDTEFLTNSTASDSLQFIDLGYQNGSIELATGTTFTLQTSGSTTIAGELVGDDVTLVKTGTGTTTLDADHEIDLLTGTSNNSTIRIEKGVFDSDGTLSAATVLVLPDGTLYVDGATTVKTLESQGSTTVTDTLGATNVTVKNGTFTLASGGEINATTVQSAGTFTVDGILNASNKVIVDPQSAFTIGADGYVTTKAVESQGMFIVDGILDGPTPTGATSLLVKPQSSFTIGPDGVVTASSVTVQSPSTFTVNGVLGVTTILAQGPFTVGAGGIVDATTSIEAQSILTVNGDVIGTSSILIGPLATLDGNLGNLTGDVTVQGRMAPSTSTGVLNIHGDLLLASTSVLDVDLQVNGTRDRIVVDTGDVEVDSGARIVFSTNSAEFSGQQTFEVLSSTSDITYEDKASFQSSGLATDYAFLDESLDLSDFTKIKISLERNSLTYADFASTPNQQRVAQHLQAATVGASGNLADALDEINQSQAGEIGPLLDAIGGESLTAFATARQILGERTARALHRRTRDIGRNEGRAFYLSAPAETPDVAAEGGDDAEPDVARLPLVRAGAWLDALGAFGQLEGDPGEADVDTLLYGGTLGADAWIAEHVVVGLAAGYVRSDVDLDDRDADVFGDTVQGALYAGFIDPRGFVSAYGRYAYTFQDSSRRIESSALSRRARADWDAQDYGAGAEAGVTLASFRGFALQPIAGIDWLRLSEESYTEHGADSLGLIVDPETLDSTTTRFGGRLFGRLDMGEAGMLAPELRAFYQHLYGDRERVLEARLSGAPSLTSIGVRGPKLPRDNLILGVGWGVMVSEHLTVSFDYDAVLGSDRVEHQGNIAARVVF